MVCPPTIYINRTSIGWGRNIYHNQDTIVKIIQLFLEMEGERSMLEEIMKIFILMMI